MKHSDAVAQGSIVSFYSFKGGVGRTMALANISFLAARMGKRVLVMDWDLEAPGLAYYFRCLQDGVDARNLKDSQGVLDLLWEWSTKVTKISSNEDFEELTDRFRSGEPFSQCVHALIPDQYRENGGALDFIGAGSKIVASLDLAYEDALARFSWSTFFDDQVGGVMLDALRNWAKRNYDFIFLDSRTGLADVAGICTMQLPDVVALCFVLNRQNIDGISNVAHAIRTKRNEEIILRALPLRLGARDSSESSDAQARAISELSRTGGFSRDAARRDFRRLAVQASDSVPYYETLVPFLTDDPTFDPLTQNFAKVASALLDIEVGVSALDPKWIDLARSRLQPKLATIEYVNRLRSSESSRLVDELSHLIDNALESVLDGSNPDTEYIGALIAGVEQAESIDPSGTLEMYSSIVDLLRALAIDDPSTWQPVLTDTIDRFLEINRYLLDPEDVLALLEEIDALLLPIATNEAVVRRIRFKREAIGVYFEMGQPNACMQACDLIVGAVLRLRASQSSLAPDQIEALVAAEIDVKLHRAYIHEQSNNLDDAANEFKGALDIVERLAVTDSSLDIRRLASQLYLKLAISKNSVIGEGKTAAFAIAAMYWSPSATWRASRFDQLSNAVLRAIPTAQDIRGFCAAFLFDLDSRGLSHIANYISRSSKISALFLKKIITFGSVLQNQPGNDSPDILGSLYQICSLVIKTSHRRNRLAERNNSRQLAELTLAVQHTEDFFVSIGFGGMDEDERPLRSYGRAPRLLKDEE